MHLMITMVLRKHGFTLTEIAGMSFLEVMDYYALIAHERELASEEEESDGLSR